MWIIDTEFQQPDGEPNIPVCLCAEELHSGRRLELFFVEHHENPFDYEYEDRGVCGQKARRPGLDALMADARRKKFSIVLVAAFDRIARSTRNFLQIIDELDSMGIEFISRREGVATGDAMGRLFVTIISAIAELEKSLLVERVKSGMRRAALEGRQIGRARLDVSSY